MPHGDNLCRKKTSTFFSYTIPFMLRKSGAFQAPSAKARKLRFIERSLLDRKKKTFCQVVKLETERDFQDRIWYFTKGILDLKKTQNILKIKWVITLHAGLTAKVNLNVLYWFCLKYLAKFNRKRSIVSIFIVPPCMCYAYMLTCLHEKYIIIIWTFMQ